jgi:acyl-coenzyme A synthetase/AMP-(fatty) acid ligase
VSSFFPQYSFLGDFHTHPFGSTETVRKQRCYNPSFWDQSRIEDNQGYWLHHEYKVSLILTVVLLKRYQKTSWRRVSSNTIDLTMGYFRLWLHGDVAYLDEDDDIEVSGADDDGVVLECPIGLR